MSFDEEVSAFLSEHPDLEVLEALLIDINGIYRGKQMPASGLKKISTSGVYFPITTPFLTVNGTNSEWLADEYGSDPDRLCLPIEGSLQLVPWAERKTAQVLLSMQELDGAGVFSDPRGVLKSVLDRYKADNLTPVVAMEYEFFLFEPGTVPPVPVAPPNGMVSAKGANCYNLDVCYDFDSILREIEESCAQQGLNVIGIVCEYGTGQFEVNLGHTDNALEACDHALMLKRAIRGVALKHGLLASFMAKPFSDDVGSGLHAHVSMLNEAGDNIFGLAGGEAKLAAAVGGLLASMREATSFFAPNANSYRRFDPGAYAPIVPNWGENNRKLSVRLPMSDTKNRRFEHRVSGADACPHLVLASVLAGAHFGMVNNTDPGEKLGEFDDVDYSDVLPSRWRQALGALDGGTILREYFSNEFVDLYLQVRGYEEEEFHKAVSNADYAQYLRIL